MGGQGNARERQRQDHHRERATDHGAPPRNERSLRDSARIRPFYHARCGGPLARLLLQSPSPMTLTSPFVRRFRLLALLRASLVAGAVYDLAFAVLMVAAPAVPARIFDLPLPPLPGGAFYLWILAILLAMLALLYLAAAHDPRRYSAIIAVAIGGRMVGALAFAGRRPAGPGPARPPPPGGGRLRLRRRPRRLLAPDPLVKPRRDIAAQTGGLGLLTGRAFLAMIRPPYEVGLWVAPDGADRRPLAGGRRHHHPLHRHGAGAADRPLAALAGGQVLHRLGGVEVAGARARAGARPP